MKILRKLLTIFLLLVLGVSTSQLYKIYVQNKDEENALKEATKHIKEKDTTININDITIPRLSLQNVTREELIGMKSENSDVIGYLSFDSGLINEPVVQTNSNHYYLDRDLYHRYNDFGTVFMNKDNKLTDDNLILYGHAGIYAGTQKFSNLNTLNHNYEEYYKNSYFTLYMENEVRRYQISYIVQNSDLDLFNHQIQNFDRGTFESWNNFAKTHSTVTSLNPLQYGDKFITLQTCVHGGGNDKVIVIAKEIWRGNYAN